jgi:hypothetical protein
MFDLHRRIGPGRKHQMTKLYSLTASGKKAKFKGTHAAAALEALKALGGEATTRQLIDYVTEKKSLKTDMEIDDAIGWIVAYLVRVGVLKSKELK